MKRLDLVVGSNGAGKSTFIEVTRAPLLPGSVYVNVEEIAKLRWPDDPAGHEAVRVAADTRARLIELDLVATAASRADEATFYDDSGIRGPRIVAQFAGGFVVGSSTWPARTPAALRTRWPNSS